MKIALLHYSSPPVVGGVESVLAHHARLMTEAGHEVSIFAGRGRVFDERIDMRILPQLDSRHAEVLQLKSELDKGNLPPTFNRLRETIKTGLGKALTGYNILIAHNVASLHKNLALTAALHELNGSPGFPRLVLWHHDLAWIAPRYRSELHEAYPWDLLRKNWPGVTQVVISRQRQQELANLLGIAMDSIRVIPNGVDLQAFFKLEPQTIRWMDKLNLQEADPLFLLPVRLTRRKNIEQALQALVKIRKKFPKAMLLITGPEGAHNPSNAAYKEDLFKLRDELNLRGSAHFLAETTHEFVPDAVIADFYRLADALILPSREEGFGIPVIEAAFSHLPVFCADIPVLRELGGDDLTYFDPDEEADGIAEKIIKRMESEATARWARRAKRGYTWRQIYNLHIAPLIQEVAR